jgi:hypothetical protein
MQYGTRARKTKATKKTGTEIVALFLEQQISWLNAYYPQYKAETDAFRKAIRAHAKQRTKAAA